MGDTQHTFTAWRPQNPPIFRRASKLEGINTTIKKFIWRPTRVTKRRLREKITKHIQKLNHNICPSVHSIDLDAFQDTIKQNTLRPGHEVEFITQRHERINSGSHRTDWPEFEAKFTTFLDVLHYIRSRKDTESLQEICYFMKNHSALNCFWAWTKSGLE